MKGNVVWHLECLALTPVHIGDGSAWDPGDYIVERARPLQDWEIDEMDDEDIETVASEQMRPKLHRINFSALLVKANPQARRRIIQYLDNGDWKGAVAEIGGIAGPDDYLETIELSDESFAEALDNARTDPRRYGQIHGFIRSGKSTIVPGSSIKGAIRTAWISEKLEQRPDLARRFQEILEQRKRAILESSDPRQKRLRTSDISDALESEIFAENSHKSPDQDPFRCLSVADAELPKQATTICRVLNYLPPSAPSRQSRLLDLNMFYEVVRSWSDDGDGVRWNMDIRITRAEEQEKCSHLDSGLFPRSFDPQRLWGMVRNYGLELWKDEFRWFWELEPRTRALIDRARRMFRIDEDPRCALIRLGRFAHFESKSVRRLRVNQHHRQPDRFRKHGETRMVVKHGEVLVPLGWVLVWLKEVKRE